MIAPHNSETVEINRSLHLPGDGVAEIYGNPMSKPVRVIFPDADRLIRPEEDPGLLLLEVDKQKGENPLQARTLWFFGKFAVPALVLLGLIGFVLPKRG